MWYHSPEHRRKLVLGVMLLTVVDRAWMVRTTMHHASDDLLVVWCGALDYARGIFHEPFFYGQDYGVMLEALLAAPFLGFGSHPVTAVAVCLGLLAIAPYLAFAWHHAARGEILPAMVHACMPLLLPVEHGLQITALNGLALLALVPVAAVQRTAAVHAFLLGLVLGFAVFVNPNAALPALPWMVDLIHRHHRQWKTWAGLVLGTLPAVVCWAGARAFFMDHKDAVVNTIFDWRMHFKPHLIGEAFERPDLHFAWTGPLCGEHGSFVLLLMGGAIAILFMQRDRAAGWAMVSGMVLIITSFCFAKVHDGSGSIFFPLSRMFLGMPILLAWACARIRTNEAMQRHLVPALVLAALLHTGYRTAIAPGTYEAALLAQEGLPVRTRSVDAIKERCEDVATMATNTGADAIVLLRGGDPFTAQFLAYGIPVFQPEAPPTWMTGHDRRTFQRKALMESASGNVLLVGGSGEDLGKALVFGPVSLIRTAAPQCAFLRAGSTPIGELVRSMP